MVKPSRRFRTLLTGIAFATLISGCSTTPEKSGERDTDALITFAENAALDGHYEAAGNAYKQLALLAPVNLRADYQLKAATLLLEGNYIAQAKRTLQTIPTATLTPMQQLTLNLLGARIALAEAEPARALELLQQPPSPQTTREQRAEYHLLRAQAYRRAGNLIEAVREYIQREPYLAAPFEVPPETVAAEIEDNQLLIWQTLMMLSETMLEQLRIDPPPDTFSGWLELALLAKNTQRSDATSSARIALSLAIWRERYPDLNVSENILAAIDSWQAGDLQRPEKIALLLPMDGNFSKVARVIRDGFFAAHYNEKSDEKAPSIRIYDTAQEGRTITELYQLAVDDGAEFIVGPLEKTDVDALLKGDNITLPTLTLNYSSDTTMAIDNLYQYGLSPEDEARQLAERAWLDGYNQALAIVPEGAWGARILQAFNERWEGLNGTVVEHQSYASSKNDFSVPLRDLLNIDESQRRKKKLQRLLGSQLKFEPRRRQDADFIFMTAFPRQARLLKPQLKFHYAGDLPVYATSHLYAGYQDKEANRDLDQITFCDIPWVLNNSAEAGNLKSRIEKLWPEQSRQYTRFYAMGIDAYRLVPQLRHMARFRYERLNGETGSLSLNEQNRIFRQLPWAHFKRGIARPL